MTDGSRAVFEFLKAHPNQEFTKHELVEELDSSIGVICGAVNGFIKKGLAVERIEETKPLVAGDPPIIVRYVTITELGQQYDPDEVERVKQREHLEELARRKAERARIKAERARRNSVL